MEEEESVEEIVGTLTALSHTFVLNPGTFFLMELSCHGAPQYIMMRHPLHHDRHQSLHIGRRYRILHLVRRNLYEGEISILVACWSSKLFELEDTGGERKELTKDNHSSKCTPRKYNLMSYKGVVTGVDESQIGIWELDKEVRLVVSFLSELTGEIWQNIEDNNPKDTSEPRIRNQKRNEYLKIGDVVQVQNAHHEVIAGRVYLVCCGRSLVKTNRVTPFKTVQTRCQSALLDVVLRFIPKLCFLTYAASIERQLVTALCPSIICKEDIVRRVQEPGPLHKLLEGGTHHGLLKIEKRSLVKEFLMHDRYCHVTEKIGPPLIVLNLKDVMADICIEDPGEVPQLFSYNLYHHKKNFAVIGKLVINEKSVLQIQNNTETIDIVIIGRKRKLVHGLVVALFNFSVAIETFRILHEGNYVTLLKKYILVDFANMIILKERECVSEIENCKKTSLTIISKSNISFIQASRGQEKASLEKFFVAKAVISQTSLEGRLQKWNSYVKFGGSLALYHPCIDVGDSYTFFTGVQQPAVELKKTITSSWLGLLGHHSDNTECLYLPEGTELLGMSPGQPHSNPVEIRALLDPSYDDAELVSVVGVIKERDLMTSKFSSEVKSYPLEFSNENHMGVPGSKILRFAIYECAGRESRVVWVYLNAVCHPYIVQYPLGILPGVKVSLTCLLRKVSKKTNSIYLQTTSYTLMTVLALPDPSPVESFGLHYYLQHIKEWSGPTKIIATVECIQKVILCPVCRACNSEMVNGRCSYVGCCSQEGGKVSINAEILIDDGSGTALMILNRREHLLLLLKLNDEEFMPLSHEIAHGSKKLSFHFLQRFRKGINVGNEEKLFAEICSSSMLHRPLIFSCRRFQEQHGNIRKLYCLSVSELNPQEDFKMWERKSQVNSL